MIKIRATIKNIKNKLSVSNFKIKSNIFLKETYFNSSSITPQEMFQELWKFQMKVGKLIGLNFLDENYVKFNYVHKLTSIMYISSFFVSVYSVHKYHNDLVVFVFCLINLAGSVQGISKIYTFTFMQDMLTEIQEIAESFHNCIQSNEITMNFERIYIFGIFKFFSIHHVNINTCDYSNISNHLLHDF